MTINRIIVGISGATGFMYGVRALELLKVLNIQTYLVMTKAAHLTRAHETGFNQNDVYSLATEVYTFDQIGASIASGSFKTMGMLIAPCSMHSLASIASGLSENLLTRAADVTLKERRRLVLMVRESPFNLAHIKNMELVTQMGAVVMPPVPAFYQHIKTLDEMVTYSVARALDLFGLDVPNVTRWGDDISF